MSAPLGRGLTVVKWGGDRRLALPAICADVATLRAGGEQLVVVHGGAQDIDALASQLGVGHPTLRSPDGVEYRHTTPEMLDAVVLALAGRVKPRILAALAAAGVPAAGLTGIDGRLLVAVRKGARRAEVDGRPVVVRDDCSGRITAVNPEVVRVLLAGGIVPVVSPPAADDDLSPLNVDADRAAAALAAALGADRLVFLTAAPGVLAKAGDERTEIARLDPSTPAARGLAASAGMLRKLAAAGEALAGGVPQVQIADGRTERPLLEGLTGAGTRIVVGSREVPVPAEHGVPAGEGVSLVGDLGGGRA